MFFSFYTIFVFCEITIRYHKRKFCAHTRFVINLKIIFAHELKTDRPTDWLPKNETQTTTTTQKQRERERARTLKIRKIKTIYSILQCNNERFLLLNYNDLDYCSLFGPNRKRSIDRKASKMVFNLVISSLAIQLMCNENHFCEIRKLFCFFFFCSVFCSRWGRRIVICCGKVARENQIFHLVAIISTLRSHRLRPINIHFGYRYSNNATSKWRWFRCAQSKFNHTIRIAVQQQQQHKAGQPVPICGR